MWGPAITNKAGHIIIKRRTTPTRGRLLNSFRTADADLEYGLDTQIPPYNHGVGGGRWQGPLNRPATTWSLSCLPSRNMLQDQRAEQVPRAVACQIQQALAQTRRQSQPTSTPPPGVTS